MAAIQDICRICLRAVHYDDIQKIDLKKVGELIKKFLLPKWDVQLLLDHIICNSCIDNFRTLKLLYKFAWRANAFILRMRQKTSKYAHLKEIDLKHLDMFRELKGDFAICRLCLEPTKHIAINLCENAHNNIIPPAYVNMMLKCVRLYMTLLDITLNPVLCFKCWQRIQISFSFRKHMDVVTEKIQRYQELTSKKDIDRESLQNVLDMWDELGTPGTEKVLATKNYISNLSIHSTSTKKKKRPKTMPVLTPEYMFPNEHNYFRKTLPNLEVQVPSINDSETETSSSIDGENDFTPTEMKKLSVSEKLRSPQIKNKRASYRKRGTLTSFGNKKNVTRKLNDSTKQSSITDSSFIRRTRLSARREMIDELNSKDLLVLKKEEIIKEKPFRNSKLALTHTPTPKVQDSPRKNQSSKSSSKHPTSEFTFERLNFDNEVQTDQISLEEEEVQIKKEVISDSDDDFIETPLIIRDEPCPNLDVFIKTEPEEIIDINEDEEPPELEFQGPCSYDPTFVISNTFTVNDKRHFINTLDEKRNLMNSVIENSSGTDIATSENNSLVVSASSRKKTVNKSPQRSLSKKLGSLQPKADPKSSSKPVIKDVVIDLYQCDRKPASELQLSKTTLPGLPDRTEKKERTYLPFNTPIGRSFDQSKNQKISNVNQIVIPAMKTTQVGPMNHNEVIPIHNHQLQKYKMVEKSPKLTKSIESPELKPIAYRKNKDDNSWIEQFYSKINDLVVDLSNPFKCKICDFITTSQKAAKIHVSSHRSNSVHMHLCKFCMYKTTKMTNLKKHLHLIHRTDQSSCSRVRDSMCSVCKSPDAKIYCTTCYRTFHPDCLITQNPKSRDCNHFSISHSVTIAPYGKASILGENTSSYANPCAICLIPTQTWVNCQQCKKFFHYHCFHISGTKRNISCRHFVYSPRQNQIENKNGELLNNQNKNGSDRRNCDFCRQPLDSVIPCPICMKFMHQTCYQTDSRQMKFGCKHTDMVGETPKAETENTLIPESKASTSKELKQEMLDLSDFIMLCD